MTTHKSEKAILNLNTVDDLCSPR